MCAGCLASSGSALDMVVNRQFPYKDRDQEVSLMCDNRGQPTSRAFMKACATLGIQQVFIRDQNPKGHADTERFRRPLKEGCLWLQAWISPLELMRALKDWLAHDNESYVHSARG